MAAVPSIGRASLVEAPSVAPQAAATQGLYERHAAKIQSYCQHQLGSREEAEDAVQTTFMNAFRALGRGVVPEAESAWLFKIAENVCLSRRRSSWRRGRIESPSDFNVIEEIVPGPSRQRDELIGIEDALASMPEQQRRAILLREWQGLSYREIAAELEVSQSAVETLIFRARRSLAQGLEQPDSIKPAKRKSFRRAMHVIDLGSVAALLKTLLAGGAAVKATAAAVAVTAAVGTAGSVGPKQDARTPAKASAAPAVAVDAKPSASSLSVTPSAAPTVEPDSSFAIATPRSAAQKPAGAADRAAPLRALPGAAPNKPTKEAGPPPQAVPEQPAADQPKHDEPKHEATPPAAAAPRTDEGKKDEGKNDEGKNDEGKQQGRGAQATPAPTEPAPVASSPKGGGNSKGKDAPTPVVEAPLPVVATTPAAVVEGKNQDSKKGRGRGNDKRELTSVAPAAAVPAPVVAAPEPTPAPDPAPAAEAVATPLPEAAPVAEQSDKGNAKRKGK